MPESATQNLSPLVSQSLSAHYDRVRRAVHALVEPLSTEQLWLRPFPYGNSVGHLLLHLTGNLSYYIGTQIAGSGYVRDRPREFADASHRPTAEVLRDFDDAVDMVLATLAAQGDGRLACPLSRRRRRGRDRQAQHVLALRCACGPSRGPDDLPL